MSTSHNHPVQSDFNPNQKQSVDPLHIPGVGAGAPAQHGPGNDPRAAPGSPFGQGFHQHPSIAEVPSIASPLPGTHEPVGGPENYTPPPFDPPTAPTPPVPAPVHGPMNPLNWESHGPGYPKPKPTGLPAETPFKNPGEGK